MISTLQTHLQSYPVPININSYWNYGFLLTISIVLQIFSGILLAINYSALCEHALSSIEYIKRELSHGWFLRYFHSNMASIIFLVLYLHLLRSLIYKSYTYLPITWFSGLLMFLFLIIIAFMGYVLPWGQMSYWAATVIINLLSPIPYLVLWISGAYLISEPTLKRFFVIHFLLPLICMAIVSIHIFYLHTSSASNPLGTTNAYSISFAPTIMFMDIKAIALLIVIIFIQTNFSILPLSHPDNMCPASTWTTPLQIVPEWYFVAFYSILKSIPSKNAGLCLMYLYIQALFLLKRNSLTPIAIQSFLLSVIIGSQLPLSTFITYGRISLIIYFLCTL